MKKLEQGNKMNMNVQLENSNNYLNKRIQN